MFDLIITGGEAVLLSGAAPADIEVNGGKIVAIGAPASFRISAARGSWMPPVRSSSRV